jgi:uncharacterized surface protein with fasciclin (FAS1) repeats
MPVMSVVTVRRAAGAVGGLIAAGTALVLGYVVAQASGGPWPVDAVGVQVIDGKLNPKVDLVSTLNGAEFTVFAPVDSAFKKIPSGTIDKLKTDDKTLTKILTYHVVPGQLAPDAVAGQHATVEKRKVTVSGSRDSLKVNDANVICGGVKTANATVYLIDTVLMPPA